jgi:hypothetical protein
MRKLIIAAALVVQLPFTVALADPPTSSATAAYSTADTDIGTLLDNAAARAVVDKHLPGVLSGDRIDMARSLTLKELQQYARDTITDKALADIDADFAKLPSKK